MPAVGRAQVLICSGGSESGRDGSALVLRAAAGRYKPLSDGATVTDRDSRQHDIQLSVRSASRAGKSTTSCQCYDDGFSGHLLYRSLNCYTEHIEAELLKAVNN